ncbi:MAG: methyl-accepting chemotaxis protein [Candidatus Zixiibacteriota bacterium]
MTWKDLSLSRKLFTAFGIVICFMAVMVVFNYMNYDQIKASSQNSQAVDYPILKGANELVVATLGVQQFCQDIAATRGQDGLDDGLRKAEEQSRIFDHQLEMLLSLDPNHSFDLRAIQESFPHYHDAGIEMARAYIKGGPSEGNKLMAKFDQMATDLTIKVDRYHDEVEAAFLSSMTELQASTERANTLSTVLSIIATVVSLLLAVFLARGISRPIARMSQIADAIAQGDVSHTMDINQKDEIGHLAGSFRTLIDYMKGLTSAVERIAANDLTVNIVPKSDRDVLGKSFTTMLANLSGMIRQLGENSRELVSAATQIASSSEQMSKGAKNQSDQVNQVSTAVEEMSATIFESSRNAGDASQAARNAAETATNGGQIVNQSIQAMQKIAQTVRQSSGSISKLANSANQIGEIIGVIDDIADQTNLLALNAAIEAARAGEQGRGFAVVADEVRKLAERTGKATAEITNMIKGIQKETTEAVHSMEAGIEVVDQGRELADQAGTSLTEIVAMAQRVTDMIQQMATASEQQSSASEEIAKNVERISGVTKETASGAEQSAAAAEQLSRQADGLQKMVALFKLKP